MWKYIHILYYLCAWADGCSLNDLKMGQETYSKDQLPDSYTAKDRKPLPPVYDPFQSGIYRKKPVEVPAIQFNRKDNAPLLQFVSELTGDLAMKVLTMRNGSLFVKTLEGDMLISDGDFLIQGVNGEFYPCKPDIFEKTYERVFKESEQ